MFDVGGPEFVFLLLLGLLVFGPRRLPAIGRQLGGFAAQARSALAEFRRTLEKEASISELEDAARRVGEFRRDARGFVRRQMIAPLEEVTRAGSDGGEAPAPTSGPRPLDRESTGGPRAPAASIDPLRDPGRFDDAEE